MNDLYLLKLKTKQQKTSTAAHINSNSNTRVTYWLFLYKAKVSYCSAIKTTTGLASGQVINIEMNEWKLKMKSYKSVLNLSEATRETCVEKSVTEETSNSLWCCNKVFVAV